jgi:hypothetical protein
MFEYCKKLKPMGCILTFKMDIQNSICLEIFIPDGTQATRNYQISPFQKDESC